MESKDAPAAATPNPLATQFQPGRSGNPDTQFKPGRSGNPLGSRAKCRYKLSEAFIRQLWLDFEEHGARTIVGLREKRPQDYLKIVASLIPRQERDDEGGPEIATVVFVRASEADEIVDLPASDFRPGMPPGPDPDGQRRGPD